MKTNENAGTSPGKVRKRVIRLDDLEQQDDAVGGASGKIFFGEHVGAANPFDDARKADGANTKQPTKGMPS